MGISVVIIAQDEERTIGDVLAAVREIAQEIVLVDSGSQDKTMEIAAGFGAKVIHNDWAGFAAQKNFALELASADWILSLDADEVVPAELAQEIRDIVSGPLACRYDGFRVARLLFIGEQAVHHGGFYPDAQLRLFRRGMGKFNDRLVHESVQLSSRRIADLKHHLLHMAYKDVNHFAEALEKYAHLAAAESQRSGFNRWKVSLANQMLHPFWTFFYRFVVRAGFLDGALGFRVNTIYADYVKKKITYLRRTLNGRDPRSLS